MQIRRRAKILAGYSTHYSVEEERAELMRNFIQSAWLQKKIKISAFAAVLGTGKPPRFTETRMKICDRHAGKFAVRDSWD
jgi:hypothetical protein